MAKIPVYILVKMGNFFSPTKCFLRITVAQTTINNLSLRRKKMRENSQMRHSKNNQYNIMEKGEMGL